MAKRKNSDRERTSVTNAEANTGISNRESARQEAEERKQHPPIDEAAPPAEDAAGRRGGDSLSDTAGSQTSHKAGRRSVAQKEAESRYPDRSMPATRKVGGAFGREPQN
jgi:hypothetical protein